MSDLEIILDAIAFAAEKHRSQRRKEVEQSPYINHPVSLARILLVTGGITDPEILAAALLHDTVEDTNTTADELESRFGPRVASIVREVSDDKGLQKEERKRLQVSTASKKSKDAKLVKLADKISNLRDILAYPPADWPHDRKVKYFEWARDVVAGARGTNQALEQEFDRVFELGQQVFDTTVV